MKLMQTVDRKKIGGIFFDFDIFILKGVCVGGGERERERETDRQTDRQTETDRQRQRQREKERSHVTQRIE